MNCGVHEADLSALLDGEIDAVEERRLKDHLAMCPTCRATFAEVRKVSGLVRRCDLPLPARSDDFVARVVRKAVAPRRLPSLPVPSPLAAAAVLLLVLGLSLGALLPMGGSGDLPPAPSGEPASYPDLTGDPDLHPGPVAVAEVPRVTPLPDLGEPLSPLPARPAEPPTGEDLYRACGLSAADQWMSKEAYGRFRAHTEQDAALARGAENREARRTAAPPLEDMHPVAAFVTSLRPGESVAHGSLVVVPLLDGDGDAGIEVVSLEQALAERIVRVEENRDSASLSGRNRDPNRHVFLARGEVLTGGHQDRVLTRDTLIPPGTTVTLPVMCCEQGRFLGQTDQFSKSPGMAPPALRRLLLGVADQERIWAGIASVLSGLGASDATATSALGRIFDTGRGARGLSGYTAALLPGLEGEKVVGFLAFSGGKLIGGEVFASHAVFTALAPRYLESYALEAMLAPEGGTSAGAVEDIPALLANLRGASFYETRAATFGRESEFEGGLSGSALVPVAGARPLHVSIFPPSEGGGGRERKPADRPKTGTRDDSGGAPPPTTGGGGAEGEGERRIRDRQRRQREGGGTKLTPPDIPEVPGPGNGGANGGLRPDPPQTPGGAVRPGGGSARNPGGAVKPQDPDRRKILEMR